MFSEDTLERYLQKSHITKQEMVWIKKLLFEDLKTYCDKCESDRMLCVLSPSCTERVLIKLRLRANAIKEDLPQFCYLQDITNLRRYIGKRTVLYNPTDLFLFNDDFFDVIFENNAKLLKKYDIKHPDESNRDLKKQLKKLKFAGVDFEDLKDNTVFQRILNNDKSIKLDTFIYQFGNGRIIFWVSGDIYISNFNTHITRCVVKEDLVDDLLDLDLLFQMYCAEQNLTFQKTQYLDDSELLFIFTFPASRLKPGVFDEEITDSGDLMKLLHGYFTRISFNKEENDNVILSFLTI